MEIKKKDFLNLKTLLNDGVITWAKFVNKELVNKLISNGAIKLERPSPKRKFLHLLKRENIFLILKSSSYNIFTIEDIDAYIEEILDTDPTRDKIQKWTGNSKDSDSKSLRGLYVSALSSVNIKLNTKEITITPFNGLGYFLFHTEKIELFEETIIVGVENYQVIWFAQKYQQFFQNKNVLFVVSNSYMWEWIETLENEYIHFGDYDLAGINIYLNTIVPRLKKCKKHSMFIPQNIEELIKEHGDRELYGKQVAYKNMDIVDTEVLNLKNIICYYKKSLEQEGLHHFVFESLYHSK